MKDLIEFYRDGSMKIFHSVESSFRMNNGDLINIKKINYKVIGVSFSLDYTDLAGGPRLRQNVHITSTDSK